MELRGRRAKQQLITQESETETGLDQPAAELEEQRRRDTVICNLNQWHRMLLTGTSHIHLWLCASSSVSWLDSSISLRDHLIKAQQEWQKFLPNFRRTTERPFPSRNLLFLIWASAFHHPSQFWASIPFSGPSRANDNISLSRKLPEIRHREQV